MEISRIFWEKATAIHVYCLQGTIGQFVHTNWSAKDGARMMFMLSAQTTDGFLWLGTCLEILFVEFCGAFQRLRTVTAGENLI
jgi:hypothetical protein